MNLEPADYDRSMGSFDAMLAKLGTSRTEDDVMAPPSPNRVLEDMSAIPGADAAAGGGGRGGFSAPRPSSKASSRTRTSTPGKTSSKRRQSADEYEDETDRG